MDAPTHFRIFLGIWNFFISSRPLSIRLTISVAARPQIGETNKVFRQQQEKKSQGHSPSLATLYVTRYTVHIL